MTIYEKAKSLVTAREAAEHYGLMVNRYGMALCPFHDDHNPSMKLDKHFPVSWNAVCSWNAGDSAGFSLSHRGDGYLCHGRLHSDSDQRLHARCSGSYRDGRDHAALVC